MNTADYLNAFYECGREDTRLLSRHGSVEFLTTLRYLEKYLRAGMRVLEIGAGSGIYSHYLAQRGYPVDAVELLECNMQLFHSHTLPGEPVTLTQGNATDLSGFADNTYDITLLLGPLYHLFTTEDQQLAVAEALRVTKPGGILFTAFCNNDATMIQYCFGKDQILPCMNAGLINPVTFQCAAVPERIFALFTKSDVDALMQRFPVTRLHYIGTDMATEFMAEKVDGMDDETFNIYLNYHFSICERPDLVGATNHMLDISRKI